MLMTMKALTEATRGLAYHVAGQNDLAAHHPDEDVRAAADDRVALLTPIVKAWSTDVGVEVASLGIQVHGGMGFIEETGAAQYYRDARIAPIYEGTNGIQALDLVGRKLPLSGGEALAGYFAEIETAENELAAGDEVLRAVGAQLSAARQALVEATNWFTGGGGEDPRDPGVGATNYLRMFGLVSGGWVMARSALAAARRLGEGDDEPEFLEAKIATARFYAEQLLPQVAALVGPVTGGAEATFAIDVERMTG
jgi:hypothetical protein